MSGGKLIDARTAALLESFFFAAPFYFIILHHVGEYVWFLSLLQNCGVMGNY